MGTHQLTAKKQPCWTLKLGQHMFRSLPAGLQALGAAQAAIRRFEKAGTKWQRPPDYYAEMVKSDQHMARVKEQLMHEQQHMEQADERWGVAAGVLAPQAGTAGCFLMSTHVLVLSGIGPFVWVTHLSGCRGNNLCCSSTTPGSRPTAVVKGSASPDVHMAT